MNIAEAERRTGLTRANIRFYEKEGLLTPTRGANGYRDYTEDDVQTLRKIMLLRRLRLSVPDIRAIESGEKALPEAAAGQLDVLQGDIRESEQAYAMCRAICEDRAEWNGLDVDRYQSIVLPADDPREKDRIPPAGCPWRRFFARNVDAGLYGLLWSMLAQWVFRINPENYIQLTASLAWTLACGYAGWLLTFVFEPVLLHYWGTTPGKWIFGLSVRDEDGEKLSIRTAYARLWACSSTAAAMRCRSSTGTAITSVTARAKKRSCRGIWRTDAALLSASGRCAGIAWRCTCWCSWCEQPHITALTCTPSCRSIAAK